MVFSKFVDLAALKQNMVGATDLFIAMCASTIGVFDLLKLVLSPKASGANMRIYFPLLRSKCCQGAVKNRLIDLIELPTKCSVILDPLVSASGTYPEYRSFLDFTLPPYHLAFSLST